MPSHWGSSAWKIDRAFVRDIHAGGPDEAIVEAIIGMAHSLGMSTVAEGVETQEQVRRLRDLGVTYMQGFFFSPPVPTDLCAPMLAGSNPGPHPGTDASTFESGRKAASD